MAKLNNWDIIALASYGASWILILLGALESLDPYPWAWIALILGLWPVLYAVQKYIGHTL